MSPYWKNRTVDLELCGPRVSIGGKMIERKPLMTFLIVAFGISWILFFAPVLLVNLDAQTRQLASLGLISLGMWGPGIGALVATQWGEGKPIRSLRLNTLGAKRMYL
jgi:hypothetical protein